MNNLLNIIGLLLDIGGVTGLYFTRIKNLNKVHAKLYSRPPLSSRAESGIAATVGNLIYELNKNIEDTERINKRNEKRSVKFFWMIVLGCTFQLASSLFSLLK